MKTPHSDLPWKNVDNFSIHDKHDRSVCFAWEEEDVPFIVKACNNHEKLVIACKIALDALEAQGIYEDRIEQLRDAIQSAEDSK